MQFLTGADAKIKDGAATAVAVGKFDGLHRGHISLISVLREAAKKRGLASAILSFNPHPQEVLAGRPIELILRPEEKRGILEELGIDYYIEMPFSREFSRLLPEDFVRDVLMKQLQAKVLVAGEHYRFGRGGAGNAALAARAGGGALEVITVPHIDDGAGKISSQAIRDAIARGDFARANDLLGRDVFIYNDSDALNWQTESGGALRQ